LSTKSIVFVSFPSRPIQYRFLFSASLFRKHCKQAFFSARVFGQASGKCHSLQNMHCLMHLLQRHVDVSHPDCSPQPLPTLLPPTIVPPTVVPPPDPDGSPPPPKKKKKIGGGTTVRDFHGSSPLSIQPMCAVEDIYG
jgi:hypothetical protein